MDPKNIERRLTAILCVDVVEFCRLMGKDDVGTLAALEAHRSELIDPKITENRGRIVKSTGDGVLVEFGSVVDAVECAVQIQQGMIERNIDIPEQLQIILRIGINLGDIIIEDNDIHGDGVNIAVRLEGEAEPGGISLSRSVHNQVRDKLPYKFKDLGEKEVKNITRPVHVFKVILHDEVDSLITCIVRQVLFAISKSWPIATVIVGVITFVSVGVWSWQSRTPAVENAPGKQIIMLPSGNPSIAVLPFSNISDDPEQEYFANGMTDDLITDLSKLSGLFVISGNTTLAYKGKPVKVRQVAKELGVRYVLEGSVRRVGDQVRINAKLIDALSGYHLWAERYDGSLADIFKLQDQVAGQIVSALAVNLTSYETAQWVAGETKNPAAFDAFLQGRDYSRRQTPQEYAKAIRYFRKSIKLDPGYGRAHANLAAIYWFAADTKWDVRLGIENHAIDRAKYHLANALEHPTSDAYIVSADMLAGQGRIDDAFAEVNKAIKLEPNNPDSYTTKAWILTMSGRAEEAEANVRLAMRLNPNFGASYLRSLGRALFFQRRHTEAAKALERAVGRLPDFEFSYHWLAATYGHLGRIEDAKLAVAKFNELTQKTFGVQLSIQQMESWYNGGYGLDKAYLAHLLEGFRKAGLPER